MLIFWLVEIYEPTTQSQRLHKIKKNFNIDSSLSITESA